MNKAGIDAVRSLLTRLVLWVGGIVAAVVIYMGLMSLIVSPKVAGYIACGLMLVGVLVFFSWMAYDDARWWEEFDKRNR